MATEEFNCFTCNKIRVQFDCPNCGNQIDHEISVPTPNLDGDKDTFNATVVDDYDTIVCENCEKEYDFTIQSSIIGGFLHIDNLDDEEHVYVEELYDYDPGLNILGNNEYYLTYKTQYDNINKLLDNIEKTKDHEIIHLQHKLIYINIVTILETYLSDALITIVLNNDKYFDIFVKNFNDFKNEKYTLNDIIDKYKGLKKTVKNVLFNITYHNIPKISGIYKSVLGITFPKYKNIMKIIDCRHNLVHRNGKDKEGNINEITKEEVKMALGEIDSFIDNIDTQIQNVINNTESDTEN